MLFHKYKFTKTLTSLLLAIFMLTSFPLSTLAVSEPNPEEYKTRDRVSIGVREGSQYKTWVYTCYGQWDIKVNGTSKGKSLYFQQCDTDKGINAIHESKVTEWAKEFNGSPDYVKKNAQAFYNRFYPLGDISNYTNRVHVRDLAELCGMSYTNSVVWKPGPTKWQPGEVNVFPTKYPGTYLNVPATANPGAPIKWQISGESFVKSDDEDKENHVSYILKQDEKVLKTAFLPNRKFNESGTVTLPKNAKPGDIFKFELAVKDAVGRVSTITKNVFIPGAGVKPPPSEPADPPEPPEPPAPPNFEPEADFFIDGAPTIEGAQVKFTDHSKHPGAKYGESITSYKWDIQGQSEASGKTATATWDQAGTYKVKLTVEDQDGDSDSCTKSVVVGPALPAAEITMSADAIILGREIHINGDGSTAALNRDIKWNEMQWEIYNPSGAKVAYTTTMSHLFNDEKKKTNAVLNQTGIWTFRLKVKDTVGNESEWTERTLQVFPDKPPKADFWLVNEAVRNSYKGYELTIYDQSEPGVPDGSLGEEITQRNWTLYYDTNNDGDFTDAADEVIYPGTVGKAARLTTLSNNDTNPKIRFSKTGRYKVELTVRESYITWGETCQGKSDNTLDKPTGEKQITVINLAPTVAFDIKKKVPVDVLFATDYTISDAKHSSLQSGQVGFTNRLISGFVQPTTEVQRVKEGDIGEKSRAVVHYEPPNWTWAGPYFRDFTATTDPNWVNFEQGSCYTWNTNYYFSNYRFNTSTGQIVSGYLSAPSESSYVYNGGPETESLIGYSYTGNTKVVADRGKLTTYRGSVQLDTVNVPMTNAQEFVTFKRGTCTYTDSPVFIGPWKDDKTIVLYQNILFTGDKYTWTDYVYLYLINNSTGAIIDSKIYTGFISFLELERGDLGIYRFDISLLGRNLLGIKTTVIDSGKEDDTHCYRCSVITPGLEKPFSKDKSSTGYSSSKNNDIHVVPINDYLFEFVDITGGDTAVDKHYIYRNNGQPLFWGWSFAQIPVYTVNRPWMANHGWGDSTAYRVVFEDGSFGFVDHIGDNNVIKYYNPNGSFKWQITEPLHMVRTKTENYYRVDYWDSFSVNKSITFLDKFIVLSGENIDGRYNANSKTVLADVNTGEIVTDIPYKYIGHTSQYLFCQGEDGNGDSLVICFTQKQGLDYVKQVINNHTWDGNKMNFIVSVIDGEYPDFEGCKAEIEQTLRDNHVKFSSISPTAARAQTEEVARNAEGGFWVQTAGTMPGPLNELADKIIGLVNEERGADCVVLVDQEVELINEYNDSENDPAEKTEWRFRQDPNKLGDLNISNSMGYSSIHNKTFTTAPKSFDKIGTFYVNCRAKDRPVTNPEYLSHSKAGQKWSSSDAELTVLVHRKPVAAFTMSTQSTMNGIGFAVNDTSYDPDLVNTDPEGKKGIRVWQWQYRPAGGDWISSSEAPRNFPSKGLFDVRLRVQDYHGAWSNWTDIRQVEVKNTPPIASFSVMPNPVQKGKNCTLTDHSIDPDGDEITAYEWNIQGIGTKNLTTPDPFPVVWTSTGNYTVTLRVRDSQGAWSQPFSQTVEVIDNKKPVAVLSLPSVGYADEQFTANGTGSYDPDPDDRVEMAYWQYKKPGQLEWSVYTTQRASEAGFLRMDFLPTDREIGNWMVKLVVEDPHGFKSDPVTKTINIQEGWELTGEIIPEVGERGRYMRVQAYAHRKGRPAEKYRIDTMEAEIAYIDAACTKSGRAMAEAMETLNMPYDAKKDDFRGTYKVRQKVYQTNRWPADGRYYIKVIGRKGTTRKEIVLPFSIKGNVFERIIIRTYSW